MVSSMTDHADIVTLLIVPRRFSADLEARRWIDADSRFKVQPDLSDLGPHDSPSYRDHAEVNVGASVRAPNGAPSRIAIRNTGTAKC
jgi:hypothetical protein